MDNSHYRQTFSTISYYRPKSVLLPWLVRLYEKWSFHGHLCISFSVRWTNKIYVLSVLKNKLSKVVRMRLFKKWSCEHLYDALRIILCTCVLYNETHSWSSLVHYCIFNFDQLSKQSELFLSFSAHSINFLIKWIKPSQNPWNRSFQTALLNVTTICNGHTICYL
jgi:hypothetical protein